MRRIHFVPALLAAVVTIAAAAPAAAVQSNLTIFLDFDNDPSTGCNDPASGFQGYTQRVVTTVETTTGPNAALVTQIEGFDCSNAQVFFDGNDHPVGIGNGDLGLNVIETFWPIVEFPPPAHPCRGGARGNCLRIGVYAENANGGTDTLFTTDDAPGGPEIVFFFGGIADIPTLSQWGLLLLVLLLAGAAARKLRRQPLRALLLVLLVLGAGGVAYAVLGDLDGNTLEEWPPGSRIAHDPAATDDGDDIASLYARVHPPSARVIFRIDASLVFNTAPVVTTTAGATTFTEDGGAVVVDAGVTVTDADSANLASATVTITNPQDGAAEVLAAGACAGLTVTPGANSLSITGSQPPATYQACFQSVTYNNTSNAPGTTPRVVAFVANDGIVSSAPGNKTVNVTPTDDAPVVVTTAGSTPFTEDDGPVVVDAGVTVSDIDNANLASATVTITNPLDGAAEVLAATACAGLTVTPGLNTLGITGSQPLATYQTCLQSVTFDDTSNNPNTTNRTISFVVNDGTLSSAPANKTVTIVPSPDAPVVVTTAPAVTPFTEDGGPVVVDAGVTVTDPDDTDLASATVTITNVLDGAAEQLNATSCAGLTVGGGGTSTLNISGTQPLATYQTCLQSVTYDNTDQDPDATNRVISFVANDGTNGSAPANKTVTVTPVNDAPVVTTTGGTTAFTEDGGPVVVDSGVTVSDVDNANLSSATVTITNPQDGAAEVLAATACGGLTVTPGLNTLGISGSLPLASYQTCLQSVTYDNTDEDPDTATTRILSFVVNDGALSSAPANKNVSVTAVNDAPVVTTTAGTTAFTEDGPAVVVDAGVTVTDDDSPNLASATVTITNVLDGASESLAATACGALTVGGSGTATLNISGSQPLATYQTCLQSVTYNNTDQDPSNTTRVISFVANDGTTSSTPATKNVSVAPANDAPVVTTTGGTTAFTEGDPAVVVDSGVTVTDIDNANLASATVTITNVLDGASESLAATACGALTVGGSGTATLNISGSQPLATYQTCLQSVTYNNTDQDPSNTTRVISFVANDGALSSTPATKNVSVTQVNDAPVVTTTVGSTSFTENGGAVVVDAGVTVTDADSPNLASATVTITNVLDVGFESLAATACGAFTVGGSGTPTLTITGSQPPATYQACLQSVTYNNTDLAPDETNRVISFVANDGALPSNTANKTVTVTAVNSAPVVTTTAGTTPFVEDAGPVVVDSGVTVTDVDSTNLASATVTITNVQDVGLETLAATACGAFTVGGSGTPTLTISGSQPPATYQTCLQSVTYNNASNTPNTTTRVISFVASDGAASSTPATKNVSVTPANDAPIVVTTAGNTAFTEDGGAVVVDSGVTVVDPDSPNLASALVTITNPQDGALETLAGPSCAGLTVVPGVNNLTITGSQPPATYQTCLQSVTYNDTAQNPGTTTRVISFVANDGALSSTPATKNVTVAPVNDAPVVTTTAGTTPFVEDAGAVVVDSGVTVTDVDSTNLASATVTITNVQDVGLETLAATACGALTVGGSGTPTLTITGSQPLLTYQTCLQSVTYNNASNTPNTTTRVISFVASDGAASSTPATKNVSITPANDAPIVVTTAGNTAFTEDGGAVVVDSGITVVDPDSPNLASALVTITNPQDGALETLAGPSCAGLTVVPGVNNLTITGSQPTATYQTCLQSVTYNDTAQNPGTTTRVISFVANDGALSSTPATKNVTVAPVNDAPVVTTTAGTTPFVEDAGAVVIDSGVTVTDVDSTNLASATVTITNVQNVGSEALAATACGALTVGGSGTPTLTITGTQPLLTYQTCLQSVTYNNSSNDPNTTTRVISFVANDGALSSAPANKNVSVQAVNDAPVVTTTAGITAFTEDGPAVVVDSGVTVSDIDNANLASATVTITNVQDVTFEGLAATACGAMTVGGSGTPTLTITGSQPLLTYQNCLQSVTYNNTDQDPTGAPNRSISFVVNDGTSSSAAALKAVSVTPVNDAPTVTTTGGTTTFTEDLGAVVIDSGVTVADVDNANLASATVTITNPQDGAAETLAGPSCAGLTVTPGVNTLSITGSQPKAAYQTCLQSVTYNNSDQDPNGAITRVISFVVNDGALSSAPATKNVQVIPVNDLPVCSTPANVVYTTPGNTQLHVNATTPGVAFWSDPVDLITKCSPTDPDGPAATTIVTGGPTASTNGGSFTITTTTGSFHFVPAVGSIAADTFTFQLNDGMGTNPQTANLTIGQRVWYIHDVINANNAAGGDGRSTNAFDTIAAFNAATTFDGDIIYVFAGNTATTPHSGSITLRDGQKLWGQGIALNVPGFGTPLVTATTQARIRSTVASTNTVNVPATAGNRLNVEIRGLDLEATGTTSNAIDATSTGANNLGVTISDNTIRGATAEGIDVNQGSTSATSTLAVSDNSLTATGTALAVDRTAGTLTVTAFHDLVVTATSVGGIAVTGVTNPVIFDVTPGGAIQPVPGGTTLIGTSGDRIGAPGLSLGNVTGALNYANAAAGTIAAGDLDIFTDVGAALSVAGGTGGFDLDVTTNAGTLVANAGPAAAISGADVSLQLNSLTSTTSTNGVSFVTVSGTFSAPTGSAITKSSGGGAAFNVDNSAPGTTVLSSTYAGTINNSSATGRTVQVNNADSGSTVFFSGQVTDTGQGVSLTTNTGATVRFSGGITLTTTTNAAFAATGGGTVEVCDENPCNPGATGATVNSITTTTGTALNVTSTNIGANRLEFQSISAGTGASGPANGILLNNTGASGGLVVAGNGGTCTGVGTCTGGRIRNTTSDGVFLSQTTNPSLTRVRISDSGDSGIFVDAVSGLSLSTLFLDSNGVQAEGGAIQDSGIHIEDLIGASNTISNTTVQDSRNTNLDWDPNNSAAQSTLTVSGTTLNHAGEGVVGQGNAGLNLTATGTANVKLVLSGGQIINNAAAGILVTGGSGTTVFTDIDAVNMVSSAPPASPTGVGWGNGVGTNFGISLTSTGTAIQRHEVTGVQLAYTGIGPSDGGSASALGFGPAGTGTFDIAITGNTIGLVGAPRSGNENFFGIAGDIQDSPTVRVNVSNNIIRNTALNGIFIQTRDPSAVAGFVDTDLTVRSNTVGPISDDDDFPFGAGPNQAETHATRIESRNDSDLCLDISANSSDGLGGNQDYLVRQRDTSTYRLERLAANTNVAATVEAFIIAQNNPPAVQTARATVATTFTAVADGTCQNPLAP